MILVLKAIAATAAISVIFTVWLILMLLSTRRFPSLASAGPLGILTLVGWAVTLTLGPYTVVQLWRLKQSGRLAGIVLFAFGAVYYTAGLIWLRGPGADTAQILVALVAYALPAILLALPAARRACS
jgi:apolipoprotein N-acyltransferase